ncbi:MAG: hypothetical protein NZT61_07845, partial [Deltaproteobacteria bacterium]|nr:hypothetical protein [Deltaproteobacteria bacterium]
MAELSFTTDIRREPAAWSRVEQKCQQLLSENYLTEVEFEELKTVIRERWDSIERFVLGEMVSDDLNAFVDELRNDPFLRLVCIYFRGSLDVWQRPIHPDDWELYSKAWDVINTYPDVGESSSLADLGGIYSPSSINSSIRFRMLEEAKTALKQLVLNQRLADIGLHNLEVAENEQRGGSRRFHSRSILRDFYLGIHKYIRSENLEFLLKQFDRLKSGELQLDYDFRLGLVARLYEAWPIREAGDLSFHEDDITRFGKPKFRGLINKVISSDPKLVDYLTQVAFGIRETASWKNGDFVRATAVMIMVNRWIDEDDRQMLVEWANYVTQTRSEKDDSLYDALWQIT